MDFKKILSNRKLRYGSFATALSVAFLVVIVLLNVIFSVLAERYPINIDLTKDSIFMLTDESVDYLKGLEKDVEVYVLADEATFTAYGGYYTQAVEVINKYSQYSKHVNVSYVDIVKNPTFTASYPDLTLGTYDILVTCNNRSRVVSVNDLFNIQSSNSYYGSSYIASSKAEQVMTSAIMAVTSDRVVKLAITTGHEEYANTGLTSLLEQNNFELVTVDLNTEDIPADADGAIMIAPNRDMDEAVLKKLDTFLSNDSNYGKLFFYFADVEQPAMPNMEAFLEEWGISVNDGVVFQTDNSKVLNYSPYFSLVDYADEKYSESFSSKGTYVTLPFSRPLVAAFSERNGFATSVLLQFGEASGVRPSDAPDSFVPSSANASGPIPGMILSTKARYVNLDRYESYVAVCGSVSAIDNSILQSTSVTNGEYFTNLFNSLTQRDDVITIAPKVLGSSQLNITAQQAYTLLLVFMVILPLAVMVTGLVIWLRRRNK